jgi:hypothetical protein
VKDGLFGQDMYIKSDPNYYFMFHHAIEAIKRCLCFDWDYLFKTDNSSYVCKNELVDLLETKPRQEFYGGQLYEGFEPHIPHPFLWGEGVSMSRDVAEFLVKFFDEFAPPIWYGAEDVYFGKALNKRFPWDTTMLIYQYWQAKQMIVKKHHVYRCRKNITTTNTQSTFDEAITAMKHIHHVLGILNNQLKKKELPREVTPISFIVSSQLVREDKHPAACHLHQDL